MRIPSVTDCYRMICRMAMLDHIAAHSLRVCQVASCLHEKLDTAGIRLDLPLIQAAALLHDITKTRSITTAENHAETGEAFLRERGFDEVGAIVGQHVALLEYGNGRAVSEAEIVNYADKRVLHDRVVSLEERMGYIRDKYCAPGMEARFAWLLERSRELEEKIFSDLDTAPDKLPEVLCEDDFSTALATFESVKQSQDR